MDYKIELIPLAVQDVDRLQDPDGNRWALQQIVIAT